MSKSNKSAPAGQTSLPVAAVEEGALAAERAEAERQAAERAEAERQAAERAEAERQAAERAEAERQAAERAEAERQAAERAATSTGVLLRREYIEGRWYAHGTVLTCAADLARAHEQDGALDMDPAAVAHARATGAPEVTHEPPMPDAE